jgi:hypothetical protein
VIFWAVFYITEEAQILGMHISAGKEYVLIITKNGLSWVKNVKTQNQYQD